MVSRAPLVLSLVIALLTPLLTSLPAAPASAAEVVVPADGAGALLFRFQTDGFWLNLHHFLYVLGRAEAEMPDRGRRAVAAAPADQERGLESATKEQRRLWRAAVTVYSEGPSQLSSTFDEKIYAFTGALRWVGETLDPGRPELGEVDPAWIEALRSAAPVYRQLWWPRHSEANREWVAAVTPLIERHGPAVETLVTRAYGLPWPRDGFPVQVSAYSNWAGAYSTEGRLLVISGLDEETRGTSLGLEVLFHEAMHQWDDATTEVLVAAAKAQNVRFPKGLSHAMLFFTVGEATRMVIPDHVSAAQVYGIWTRSPGRFLPALEDAWRPYVQGVVSRDMALARLMLHFGEPRSPESSAGGR
ncbi:MAG: hypothetical protein AAGN66_14675 [Acidobacteriota bacterium]